MAQAMWLLSVLTPHLWSCLRGALSRTMQRSRTLSCWLHYPGDNRVSLDAKSKFTAAFQGSPRNRWYPWACSGLRAVCLAEAKHTSQGEPKNPTYFCAFDLFVLLVKSKLI